MEMAPETIKALHEVFHRLDAMSDEEFRAALKAHEGSEFEHMLNPNPTKPDQV